MLSFVSKQDYQENFILARGWTPSHNHLTINDEASAIGPKAVNIMSKQREVNRWVKGGLKALGAALFEGHRAEVESTVSFPL